MATINIPQIRFKGFEGEWEKKILGEVVTICSMKRVHQSDWTTSGIRFFRARDVVAAFKNEEIEPIFISEEKYREYSSLCGKVSIGDLLVTGVGTIGVPYLIKDSNPIYIKDGNIIWMKNNGSFNGEFLYHCFCGNKVQQFIKETAGTGTVGTYTIANGKKTPIDFTSLPEQNKIASLFTSLDKQISVSEAKLDKLRTIKKTLLKKMFAAQGELTPQIRFKGFDGAWEEKFIESVCEISTGKSNTQDKNDEGIYPFYVRSSIIEKSDKYLYDEEAVLTAGDGVGTGKIYHYVNGKYNLHQRCYRMFNFKNIEAKFFFYVFSTKFYKRVMAMTAKSSVDSVRYDMIAKMNIQLPQNKNEQTKIANLLTSADKQISLQEQKIEKLKAVKKTLLKKMFV